MKRLIIKSRHNDKGFVSIFSVIIIMSILTLVLVGFSNITRQAQRRTLDDQLNTQAFYAAESGINDAKTALTAAALAGTTYNKSTCEGQDAGSSFNYNYDSALSVGYSCVLINSNPSDVRFSSIGIEGASVAKTVTLASLSGNPFDKFSVYWDSPTQGDLLPNSNVPSLTPRAAWGTKVGMLRMDVVPVVDGALDRATLVANSYSMFLYPTSDNAGIVSKSYSPGPAAQGSVDLVTCDTSPTPTNLRCKLDITLTGAGISKRYMLRLQAIYNVVQADVADVKDTTNTKVSLKDGQAVVDVTGRANDVFRRVQVRLPLKPTGFVSSTVLQSADSVCKLLAVGPTTTVDTSGIPAGAERSCLID